MTVMRESVVESFIRTFHGLFLSLGPLAVPRISLKIYIALQ